MFNNVKKTIVKNEVICMYDSQLVKCKEASFVQESYSRTIRRSIIVKLYFSTLSVECQIDEEEAIMKRRSLTLGRLLRGGFKKQPKKYTYKQYKGVPAVQICILKVLSQEMIKPNVFKAITRIIYMSLVMSKAVNSYLYEI